MSVYLHDIPLPQARARLEQALAQEGRWTVLEAETIPLDENALGRVLADTAWAQVSSPHYHASAMDGYAVAASTTEGAQPASPLTLDAWGAEKPRAAYIDTGDPL